MAVGTPGTKDWLSISSANEKLGWSALVQDEVESMTRMKALDDLKNYQTNVHMLVKKSEPKFIGQTGCSNYQSILIKKHVRSGVFPLKECNKLCVLETKKPCIAFSIGEVGTDD